MDKYEKKNRSAIKNRRKKIKRRRILSVFLFLLLIIGSIVGYIFYQTYNAASESYTEIENRTDGKSKLREEPVQISTDPVSILLLGIEDYSDEFDKGRSDTLMVATFNPSQGNMKLLSIPRDTLVKIPGRKNRDKINHSFSYGGKELTIETVEDFLDIPIDYFVTVNFQGFINIVDELGGVNVEVPFDFSDINNKWDRFYFKEGKMHLDGEEALVYARMRKYDPRGDFGRNDRQKQIVMSVIDKLSTPKTLLKIDDIGAEIGRNVETNLRIREALAFRKKYSDFNSTKIETLNITGYDKYINDVYYFEPDDENIATIKEELQNHLHGNQMANSSENESGFTTENGNNEPTESEKSYRTDNN
ncbi:LCP family protein [Bacillus sp. JJ1521]|uniref:LCP family protein n=1 Tax=Bacillus sp. JJ1521 TaxID=3122957 RepID=UPI0030003EA2